MIPKKSSPNGQENKGKNKSKKKKKTRSEKKEPANEGYILCKLN